MNDNTDFWRHGRAVREVMAALDAAEEKLRPIRLEIDPQHAEAILMKAARVAVLAKIRVAAIPLPPGVSVRPN